MKQLPIITILPLLIFISGCNSGDSSSNQVINQGMNISITPNSTGVCSYVNAPCVSVSICDSSGNNCSTVNNVLLDTGSYGLRLFNSTISQNTLNNLKPITDKNNNPVGECVSYGDGSQNWGGVYKANINLSSDAIAANVPIQIINSSFYTPPSECYNATQSPQDFGLNGVLGVGLYIADGGSYYSCNNNGCSAISLSSNEQVSNPISFLPNNNNGLTLLFPSIPLNGAKNQSGTLYFGVNTNSQNTFNPSNVYKANTSNIPTFSSQYNSNSYSAFLDSGTNTLSIANSGLTSCEFSSSWLCPSNNTNLTFLNYNSNNTGIQSILTIGNASSLLNTNNTSFSTIGTNLNFGIGLNYVDYGLPYFYGKTVQLVFQNSNSNLGTGPFWAW